MFFWNLFFFHNKLALASRGSKIRKNSLVKVKFVREQRIFAKGSRGPVKKRSTGLLRYLKLYIIGNKLQNLPPFSTALNLYGINVQKLCDECNKSLKTYFYEDIPIVLELWINKDLNFTFKINSMRFNILLQSIDSRFYKMNLNYSFFIKRYYNSKEIKDYYLIKDSLENYQRDFSFLDFWIFILIFFFLYFRENSCFSNFFAYSLESNMRMFLSQMYSLNNIYRFREFKILN